MFVLGPAWHEDPSPSAAEHAGLQCTSVHAAHMGPSGSLQLPHGRRSGK